MSRLGYYLPWIVASGSLSSVSLGLISTFLPGTNAGKRIGYQIILGFSRGLGIQMPLIAVQNSIAPKFVPVSMALVSFGQTFGGAVFLAICETILSNQLTANMPKYAPTVDPAAVVAAGGSGSAVRAAVESSSTSSTYASALAGTLMAYSKSIDAVFWFAAGAAGLMALVSLNMGWKDIRKKEAPPAAAAAAAAEADPEKGIVDDASASASAPANKEEDETSEGVSEAKA